MFETLYHLSKAAVEIEAAKKHYQEIGNTEAYDVRQECTTRVHSLEKIQNEIKDLMKRILK